MAEIDLLAELDEAEFCRCGKTHEECAEDGGCKYTREREELAAARAKLAAVRELAGSMGDRSGEARDSRPSDRRVVAPIQRMLYAILDGTDG